MKLTQEQMSKFSSTQSAAELIAFAKDLNIALPITEATKLFASDAKSHADDANPYNIGCRKNHIQDFQGKLEKLLEDVPEPTPHTYKHKNP